MDTPNDTAIQIRIAGFRGDEPLLSAAEAARTARRSVDAIYQWVKRGHLTPIDRDWRGRPLFRRLDVLEAEKDTRNRDKTGRVHRMLRASHGLMSG